MACGRRARYESAGGGNRTHTGVASKRILGPTVRPRSRARRNGTPDAFSICRAFPIHDRTTACDASNSCCAPVVSLGESESGGTASSACRTISHHTLLVQPVPGDRLSAGSEAPDGGRSRCTLTLAREDGRREGLEGASRHGATTGWVQSGRSWSGRRGGAASSRVRDSVCAGADTSARRGCVASGIFWRRITSTFSFVEQGLRGYLGGEEVIASCRSQPHGCGGWDVRQLAGGAGGGGAG